MSSSGNSFTLHGARGIIDSTDALPVIEELVDNLESAVESRSPIAFELAKSLIDSVCKTILTDRGIEINRNWDTPQLFRETLSNLSFIPAGHPDPRQFRERMTTTIRGLEQTVRGLCELRNHDGLIAHGADGYQEIEYTFQTELAARASDAIIPFIYSAHKNLPSDLQSGRIYYDDYLEFNEYLDETYGVIQLEGQEFLPSWTIFTADKDRKTYRELLIEYELYKEEQDEIGEPAV
ncbi:MAG: abortive infection family protein [Chloroflexi bacterium]|nr:abortive infection family protein [Chloroflexota bacterium]